MNCSEAGQFFDAYLDGELTGSLRLEFDAHRLRCTACQQKLAMMEACEHILAGDARAPKLSVNFTNNVMNDIRQKGFRAGRKPRRRVVLVAAGLMQAAAVIVFAFLWINHQKVPVKPPGSDTGFTIAAGESIDQKDSAGLLQKMQDRMAELKSAPSLWGNDFRAIASYAPSLLNIGELPQSVPSNPLDWLFPMPVEKGEPLNSQEAGPPPDASDTVSM